MIRVIGVTGCATVEIVSDPYIPLTVTWGVGGSEQPLYWRISSDTGAELEIKVDPHSGALRELIVIDEPSGSVGDVISGLLPDPEPGIPVFDCSAWGVAENPDYSEFTSGVLASSERVTLCKREDAVLLSFSEDRTSRILECGDAQVHLADDGSITAFMIRSTSSAPTP